MSGGRYLFILFNVVMGASQIGMNSPGFAAMSFGISALIAADAICDAITGAKP